MSNSGTTTTTFSSTHRGSWLSSSRLIHGLAALPWWVKVTAIYAASRLFSLCVLLASAHSQGASPWGAARPDYSTFINFWDSEWYRKIFDSGYPSQLPSTSGHVAQNPWAFYPVFPLIVRFISVVTGLGWATLAPIVALCFGLVASLAIYRLFRLRVRESTALFACALVVFSPVSAILQIPYAESTNLAFLALSLYFVLRGKYFWALPFVVLSDLSRPVGSAFACFAVLHLLSHLLPFHDGLDRSAWRFEALKARWRRSTPTQWLGRLTFVIVSLLGAIAWVVIAAQATGDPHAYLETEAAWRAGPLYYFLPWVTNSQLLFGPIFGPLALTLLVVGSVILMLSPLTRRMGTDLKLYTGSYALYLFAVIDPWTSTFRLMLPLFPLALGLVAASRSTAYRITMLCFSMALQVVWVVWLWNWAQLPGGGDYPP